VIGIAPAGTSESVEFGYDDCCRRFASARTLERTLRVLRERQRSPILVGGAGEKVLLRLVAQYADACNFTDSFDPAFYRHKLDVLRRHCEDLGRDYDAIEKTASFTVNAGDDVDFAALEAAGIETFIVYLDPPTDLERLERFARSALSGM
jgi:alkanesulfonate monooxygenase SsuD/methylene tetrahydromethanopterin reductase-like flavin-dependent oxidoreductase (luciferase family)